jgi:hypothetical protein
MLYEGSMVLFRLFFFKKKRFGMFLTPVMLERTRKRGRGSYWYD